VGAEETGGVFAPDAGTVLFGDAVVSVVFTAPQATVLGAGAMVPDAGAVWTGFVLEAMVVAARVTFGWPTAVVVAAVVDAESLEVPFACNDAALAARNFAINSLNSFSGSLMSAVMSC